MSLPAFFAAWAPARALPAFCRPSVSITIRFACPGGNTARASWIAWKMLVPRPSTSDFGRSSVGRLESCWSTTAASPNTIRLWRSPGFIDLTASATNRYARSRAARLTLSDMSRRNTTFIRSTQRGNAGRASVRKRMTTSALRRASAQRSPGLAGAWSRPAL